MADDTIIFIVCQRCGEPHPKWHFDVVDPGTPTQDQDHPNVTIFTGGSIRRVKTCRTCRKVVAPSRN